MFKGWYGRTAQSCRTDGVMGLRSYMGRKHERETNYLYIRETKRNNMGALVYKGPLAY